MTAVRVRPRASLRNVNRNRRPCPALTGASVLGVPRNVLLDERKEKDYPIPVCKNAQGRIRKIIEEE